MLTYSSYNILCCQYCFYTIYEEGFNSSSSLFIGIIIISEFIPYEFANNLLLHWCHLSYVLCLISENFYLFLRYSLLGMNLVDAQNQCCNMLELTFNFVFLFSFCIPYLCSVFLLNFWLFVM